MSFPAAMEFEHFLEGRDGWVIKYNFLNGWDQWDKRLPLPSFWERSREMTPDGWQECLGLAEEIRPFDADFFEFLWHNQEMFAVYTHERRRSVIVAFVADTSDLPAKPHISLGILLDHVKFAFLNQTIVPVKFQVVLQDFLANQDRQTRESIHRRDPSQTPASPPRLDRRNRRKT